MSGRVIRFNRPGSDMVECRGPRVKLVREKPDHPPGVNTHIREPMRVTYMLPFGVSSFRPGLLVHRVRSAKMHWEIEDHEKIRQTSVKMWCGYVGYLAGAYRWPMKLHAEPPASNPSCAVCEAKALAAGYGSTALLALRPISYRPRL